MNKELPALLDYRCLQLGLLGTPAAFVSYASGEIPLDRHQGERCMTVRLGIVTLPDLIACDGRLGR